jgi:hypothetical protein
LIILFFFCFRDFGPSFQIWAPWNCHAFHALSTALNLSINTISFLTLLFFCLCDSPSHIFSYSTLLYSLIFSLAALFSHRFFFFFSLSHFPLSTVLHLLVYLLFTTLIFSFHFYSLSSFLYSYPINYSQISHLHPTFLLTEPQKPTHKNKLKNPR